MRRIYAAVLAVLSLTAVLCLPTAVARQAAARTKHLVRAFEYTVREGPDANALVVAGTLDLHYNVADGTFTGKLTPGVDTNHKRYDSVLLKPTPRGLVPVKTVKSIKVRGQYSGYALHLVLLDVGSRGSNVYATGTTTAKVGPGAHNAAGDALGWAVGPQIGDAGNIGGTTTVVTIKITCSVCTKVLIIKITF
jgi:hypothetical protein